MLKITNFSKSYKSDKKAVDTLNLEVLKGDIFGFIGHNGAGKTTTIRAIAGVLDFEEGEITVEGLSIKKDPVACKQRMAYIPDNPDLYEHLTGIGYLNFIGDIFRVDKTERKAVIEKYADTFELTQNLGDTISSYSHGMKQKLALISALIHKPKLLVLDEPVSGVDQNGLALFLNTVLTLRTHHHMAILLVSHDLSLVEQYADYVVLLDRQVLCAGSPGEVFASPEFTRVFQAPRTKAQLDAEVNA
jgi:ABC-2 type transport system ATP-binding protein